AYLKGRGGPYSALSSEKIFSLRRKVFVGSSISICRTVISKTRKFQSTLLQPTFCRAKQSCYRRAQRRKPFSQAWQFRPRLRRCNSNVFILPPARSPAIH